PDWSTSRDRVTTHLESRPTPAPRYLCPSRRHPPHQDSASPELPPSRGLSPTFARSSIPTGRERRTARKFGDVFLAVSDAGLSRVLRRDRRIGSIPSVWVRAMPRALRHFQTVVGHTPPSCRSSPPIPGGPRGRDPCRGTTRSAPSASGLLADRPGA